MKPGTEPLNRLELRTAGSLAGIIAIRLLGLFLIMPVFAAYARDVPGATPLLIGTALGIYGLTQGALQIPFGWLSDRVGRRPVMAGALVLFIAGSVLAAVSDHILGIIAGRALQGGGAIAGAGMALAADASRESQRSKVMALIGVSVGGAFVLAMLAGPLLAGFMGLSGLFWITAGLGVTALVLLALLPRVPGGQGEAPGGPEQARLSDAGSLGAAVWMLCSSSFLLHALMTAMFVGLPIQFEVTTGMAVSSHWKLYLPSLAVAGALSLGLIFLGREEAAVKRLLPAIAVLVLAAAGFAQSFSGWGPAMLLLGLFFAAFNLLEATLPALMTRRVGPRRRGTAMGLYATGQFLGAFLGGTAGGAVLGGFGIEAVFWLAAGLGGVWLVLAASLRGALARAEARGFGRQAL